ncbi:putative cytochrome P450 [Nemania sp. NC0429]|nr:putative cytochrome P450 [Nemania sp. NC0429]
MDTSTLGWLGLAKHLRTRNFVDVNSISILLPFVALLFVAIYILKTGKHGDGLCSVNRSFWGEPAVLARVRWALGSRKILDHAFKRLQNRPYRLFRGDMDLIVLPSEFIPELNSLPQNSINSRFYHSFSVLGHVTGLNVVRKTNHHMRVLLGRVSPMLPTMLQPTAHRISAAVARLFPQNGNSWDMIDPLEIISECVTEAIVLILYGRPTCDNPEVVRLCHQITKDAFTIVIIMRCVPASLQRVLVWFLPAKWRLQKNWKKLEKLTVPVVNERKLENTSLDMDLLTWMVTDGKSYNVTDASLLARLAASVAAGGIYSTANLVVGVLVDLTARPELCEEIREEIQVKHIENHGCWDNASFSSLPKLESVLKETSRFAPGSLLVYSRLMETTQTLSNGLVLPKGQFITISAHSRSMDSRIFPMPETYSGLRHYTNDTGKHYDRPFNSIDGDILTWGAGRSACPGRFIATLVAKILLVKLLSQFEFKFVNGECPEKVVIHEFVLSNPFKKLLVRQRDESLEFNYK